MDFKKMTDIDVAYYIMQQRGKENAMYYKELILEVIEKKQKPVRNPENPEAEAISEIYTQINMDSRFHYVKDGSWGLTEWYPEVKRVRGVHSEEKKTDEAEM